MATFTIEVSEAEKYIIDVNTSTADSFTSSSSQDKFFLEIEQGIAGTAETTKNIIEITTSVDSASSTNSITIEKVNDINLVITTDFIIDHPTISAASSVDNDGNLFIQDIFLDQYGHITGINSAYATGTGIGGGASTFLDLTDTPSTFSGNNSKVVAVNSSASALEFISGVLISGTDYHPSINAASSSDNSGQNFIQDILLDNYGHITGIVVATASGTGIVSGSDIYITGITYNSSISELVLTHQSGSVTGILNGVVHTGDLSEYATTGELNSVSGYLQDQIDNIPEDTNTFITGIIYSTQQREIVLSRNDGASLTGDIGVVLHSGDYIGFLNNSGLYALSGSHIGVSAASDTSNSGSFFIQNLLFDTYGHVTGVSTALASGTGINTDTYATNIVFNSGNNELVLQNNDSSTVTGVLSGVIISGDNVSHLYNDIGYITGFTETDPIFTGSPAYTISTGDIANWNDSYGWGDHSTSGYLVSGDNISVLNNDAGYITGYTETGLNTFITGLTFDSGNNNLILQRNDSITITGHLEGVLVSGTNYHIPVNGTGINESGRTYVQDIFVDPYGHITGITTSTETVVDTNVFVTGITYNSSTHSLILSRNSGSITGILDNIIHSGDNVSFLNNDAGYITSGNFSLSGQLDGNLDLNGYDIVGTGNITIDGDVEANQFIGNLRGAIYFTAQAGEALTKGDVVYISGISGNKTVVSKADANDSSKMPAFGIAAETVNNNANVNIITFGSLYNIDTDTPDWDEGDELYVSNTAGVLTKTAPTGESSQIQKIAKVTRRDNSAGSIKVMGAGRTNATPNLNEGRLFVGNSSNQAVADGTIHVDISNSRVGIGTATPSEKLNVENGNVVFNDLGGNYDFRVEGDGETHLFQTDANKKTVGIGQSDPTYKLYVKTSNSDLDEDGLFIRGVGVDPAVMFMGQDTNESYITAKNNGILELNADIFSGAGGSAITFNVDDSEVMRVDYQDRVGILTASPETTLDVRGTIQAKAAGVKIQSVDSSVVVKQQAYSVGNIGILGTESNHNLEFRANNIGYMYLTTSGDVGIGTASPATKLHVVGDFSVSGGSVSITDEGYQLILRDTSSSNELKLGSFNTAGVIEVDPTDSITASYMQFGVDGNIRMQLLETSNVLNYSTTFTSTDGSNVSIFGNSVNVFNEDGNDIDFQVKGENDDNLLYVDANNDKVGIGTASPSEKLDIRYPTGGGMALIKDSDSNDGLLFGDMAYSTSDVYQGITHVGMTGSSDYMMISEGTNTLMSAKGTTGRVYIRGGGNYGSNQILVYGSSGYTENAAIELDAVAGKEIVVNQQQRNVDFRVESNTDEYLLFTDASANRVGIKTSSPDRDFHVNGETHLDGTTIIGTGLPSLGYRLTVDGNAKIDQLNINGNFTFPTTDGSADQVLVTNGSGALTWQDQQGAASSSNYIYSLIFR